MPYRRPEDELAKGKKDWYRRHPDQDPQGTVSKVLEAVGLDEPYRNDSGSYDYRKQAWDESMAQGNPDMSWFLPELSDESKYDIGTAIEQVLGNWNPGVYMGVEPLQEKRNPLPDFLMGKKERPGNAAPGALAHALKQWDWLTPYDAEDILSLIGPDSPDTVRRDIDAYKGGSSSMDRAIGGAVGVPDEEMGPKGNNPAADAVEWGSLAIGLGAPAAIARAGKAAVSGGKKAAKIVGLTKAAARDIEDIPAGYPLAPVDPLHKGGPRVPVGNVLDIEPVRTTIQKVLRKKR